jgi:dCMP deaminase
MPGKKSGMRNKEEVMITLAMGLSILSTCSRRRVGCVLVDSAYRIIGTGYNGVPRGVIHCTDHPCPYVSHQHGSSCWATHAEVNAISQCQNTDKVWTVFTTTFPCIECFKLIMNTEAKRIVYIEDYPANQEMVKELNNGRIELCPYS